MSIDTHNLLDWLDEVRESQVEDRVMSHVGDETPGYPYRR